MDAVLVSIDGGWVDSRLLSILARLRERDRLLTISAVCDSNRQVRWYEATRLGPDGRDQFVGRWGPEEVDRILSDIELMDRAGRGHVETVDRLKSWEDKRDKQASRDFHDAYMEMLEHGARIIAEEEDGKTFHGQAGVDFKK